MDRLTKFAAKLYPRWWRERYGDEFAALLEDARPGSAGTLDILRGAVAMQLATISTMRTIVIGAITGMLVGLATTFLMTPQYSSSGIVSVRAPAGSSQADVLRTIKTRATYVLDRKRLENLVFKFDLYRDERQKMPTKDVLEKMRQNIRIIAAPSAAKALEVSFDYPDRLTATKVTTYLVFSFLEQNRRRDGSFAVGPEDFVFELLAPATLPTNPVFPNRRQVALAGLGTGLALGGVAALILRRRTPLAA